MMLPEMLVSTWLVNPAKRISPYIDMYST